MQTQRQYLARMYEKRRPVHVSKDVGRPRETKDDDVVLTSYEVNGLFDFSAQSILHQRQLKQCETTYMISRGLALSKSSKDFLNLFASIPSGNKLVFS